MTSTVSTFDLEEALFPSYHLEVGKEGFKKSLDHGPIESKRTSLFESPDPGIKDSLDSPAITVKSPKSERKKPVIEKIDVKDLL